MHTQAHQSSRRRGRCRRFAANSRHLVVVISTCREYLRLVQIIRWHKHCLLKSHMHMHTRQGLYHTWLAAHIHTLQSLLRTQRVKLQVGRQGGWRGRGRGRGSGRGRGRGRGRVALPCPALLLAAALLRPSALPSCSCPSPALRCVYL